MLFARRKRCLPATAKVMGARKTRMRQGNLQWQGWGGVQEGSGGGASDARRKIRTRQVQLPPPLRSTRGTFLVRWLLTRGSNGAVSRARRRNKEIDGWQITSNLLLNRCFEVLAAASTPRKRPNSPSSSPGP